jgi:hypothetical protein
MLEFFTRRRQRVKTSVVIIGKKMKNGEYLLLMTCRPADLITAGTRPQQPTTTRSPMRFGRARARQLTTNKSTQKCEFGEYRKYGDSWLYVVVGQQAVNSANETGWWTAAASRRAV